MFVGQGDQIFMNDVFLKRLTAPTITSGGNPPGIFLTPLRDGRLTAKNADISGNVNAESPGRSTTSRLTRPLVLENCPRTRLKAISLKQWASFPGIPAHRNGMITITVRVYDDQPFDRQIVILRWHSAALNMKRAY